MSSNTEFDALWEEACATYTEQTGVDLQSLETPANPDELFNYLEKSQEDFEKYRAKKATLYNTLSLSLTPIEVLSGVAGGAVSTVCCVSDDGVFD
jgi:hypothetical protein